MTGALIATLIVGVAMTLAARGRAFLVPGPQAIPAGFSETFRSVSDAQYAVQFNAADDGSQLSITEHTAASGASYAQQTATFATMQGNRHGPVPRRITDFTFEDSPGAVYEMTRDTAGETVLLWDDHGMLLTIWARSGARHRFTPADLRGMLSRFERRD